MVYQLYRIINEQGDTRRANAATGTIFNAYNAIEQRALQNGVNINSLFSNINNTPNSQRIIDYIHQYAGNVGYFTSALFTIGYSIG